MEWTAYYPIDRSCGSSSRIDTVNIPLPAKSKSESQKDGSKPEGPKPRNQEPKADLLGSPALAMQKLIAETSADGNAATALGATTAEHSGSALSLHAGSEAVSLDPLAAVGLKCALGHGSALLNLCGNLCLNGKS